MVSTPPEDPPRVSFSAPAPVGSNGTLYHCTINGTTRRETLSAVNAYTGAAIWEKPLPAPVYSNPAIADGILYIRPAGGGISAYAASTGTFLWNYPGKNQQSTSYPAVRYFNPPVIHNGTLYIETNREAFSLDAKTGDERWTVKKQTLTPGCGRGAPALNNGLLYCAGLEVLDSRTGALRWVWHEAVPEVTPDGYTYAVTDYLSSPATVGDIVYALRQVKCRYHSFACFNYQLVALDAKNGSPLWVTVLRDSKEWADHSVIDAFAVENGILCYIRWWDGFYALNATTGAQLWSVRHELAGEAHPAIFDGCVYFGCNNGVIYAYDLKTGTLLWEFSSGKARRWIPSYMTASYTSRPIMGNYMRSKSDVHHR